MQSCLRDLDNDGRCTAQGGVAGLAVLLAAAILALAASGCGKDPPLAAPAIVVPTLPTATGAPAAVPQINAPIADEEEEPAPAGPAVEVNVADSPNQPLAYYRGNTTIGAAQALQWSRKPAAKKAIVVRDGLVALRGDLKPGEAIQGPAVVAGEGPLLVSIGADWCVPCSHELADVLELANKLRPGKAKTGEVRLVMVLEGTPDEWPLAEVRDGLFAKHAKAKKLSRPLAKPPWAEFRADIESSWGAAIDQLGVLGGSKTALPINLLLDRCGHVQAAASGSLNAAKKQVFLDQLARLQAASCYPAPMAIAAPAPVRPAAPRSGADARSGDGKAPAEAGPAGAERPATEGALPGDAMPAAGDGPAIPGGPDGASATGGETGAGSAKPLSAPAAPKQAGTTAPTRPGAPAVKPAGAATETGKSGAKE